jgi:hypothetical protein
MLKWLSIEIWKAEVLEGPNSSEAALVLDYQDGKEYKQQILTQQNKN